MARLRNGGRGAEYLVLEDGRLKAVGQCLIPTGIGISGKKPFKDGVIEFLLQAVVQL